MSENLEAEDAARAKLAEALSDYYDARGGGASILTGYVVAYEVTPSHGVPQLFWMSGTGASPELHDDRAGLAHHRAVGLLMTTLERWQMKNLTWELKESQEEDD